MCAYVRYEKKEKERARVCEIERGEETDADTEKEVYVGRQGYT